MSKRDLNVMNRHPSHSDEGGSSNNEESNTNVPNKHTVNYSNPQHSRQAAFSLLWLFVFSCGMFTLPFAAFFGVRNYVQVNYADATTFYVTAVSVLASVLTVNVIIVAYALLGYHETEYDEQGRELDQSIAVPVVNPSISSEPPQEKQKKKRKPLKEQ